MARPKQLPPDHPRHPEPDKNGYRCRWVDAEGTEHNCQGQDDWFIWLFMAGRGCGKRLDADTPLPVPGGWKRLGDLNPGEYVFDHAGKPARVLAVYDGIPSVAYRLTFSDGSTLDADADHLWATWTQADRRRFLREGGRSFDESWPAWRSGTRGPQVRTTKEIAASLTAGTRADTNHCIPVCGPLQLPEAELPVEPYLLGAWLGDGSKYAAQITVSDGDAEEMLRLLAASGAEVTGPPQRKPGARCASYPLDGRGTRHAGTRNGKGQFTSQGKLHAKLRELNLLLNKHVPAIYLRASAGQRLALLQGLMDTDGGWSGGDASAVEFSNTNRLLAEAVAELARSLGQKATVHEGRAKINGRDCGPKWRVTWTPTVNVFRLSRKAGRFSPEHPQALRNHHRMIKSAVQIAPRPMRCITVESEHGLFLAGETMIPTHNTLAGANWILENALLYPETRWAVVAPTYDQVQNVCFAAVDSGIRAQAGKDEIADYNKNNMLLTLANGSEIKGFSADTPERMRGYNLSGAWLDEVGSFRYRSVWDEVLEPALRKGDPHVIVTTTPAASPLLKEWYHRWMSAAKRGETCDIHLTTASFHENDTLPPKRVEALQRQYGGTRIGRQELEGQMLEDFEGALWKREFIEEHRVPERDFQLANGRLDPEKFTRVVVGFDPSMTSGEHADEHGIVVAGQGQDSHGYIIADWSCQGTPDEACRRAVAAYYEFYADCIVTEANQAGDWLTTAIRAVDAAVPVRLVRAVKGKYIRAQPVSMLAEQGRLHHIGIFPKLEDQICVMTPDSDKNRHDDRADAMIWAMTDLRGITEGSYMDTYGFRYCNSCGKAFRKTYAKCPNCGNESDKQNEKPARPGQWASAYLNTCGKCGGKYTIREQQCPNCNPSPAAYMTQVSRLTSGGGKYSYNPKNWLGGRS